MVAVFRLDDGLILVLPPEAYLVRFPTRAYFMGAPVRSRKKEDLEEVLVSSLSVGDIGFNGSLGVCFKTSKGEEFVREGDLLHVAEDPEEAEEFVLKHLREQESYCGIAEA